MAGWTYLHIENVTSALPKCVFCNRPLRSGKALVVVDDSGNQHFAGQTCAKKELGKPPEKILDLSRLASLVIEQQGATDAPLPSHAEPAKAKATTATASDRVKDAEPAERYLRLRAEHMRGFTGHVTHKLSAIHALLDGGLSDEDHRYIQNLMSKAKQENTIYSVSNIERCIGTDYWLSLAIANTAHGRQEFLVSMQKALRENWKLTGGQLTAINKWGEGLRKKLPDFPVLDSEAFSGVLAPKFVKT